MFNTNLFRVFISFIVLGLAFIQHTHSHSLEGHNEEFAFPPGQELFLPVTDEYLVAWDRVIEHCFPLNTQGILSDHCMTSLSGYFANEPVWSYGEMYVYDHQGWRPLGDILSLRRNHSPADFLNPDVPFWRHIFDDEIEQRQELFLRVVNDSQCKELARFDKDGMHDYLAEHCEARELYKYAAYLSACFDANHRLSKLQRVISDDGTQVGGLTEFEMSFLQLDENVSNELLKSAAKSSMEKNFLHASWVAAQCSHHGFVVQPGVTTGSFTSSEEKLPWSALSWRTGVSWLADERKYHRLLSRTHEFIMKVSMKSGDDWAIRSGSLSRSFIAEFGDDLMQRYPLLIHRVLGDPWSNGGYGKAFTPKEHARHRAKAYLLLVEEAGEEFARSEYDPASLTNEIRYVESGGLLTPPHSRAQVQEENREWIRQHQEKKLLEEAQSELSD